MSLYLLDTDTLTLYQTGQPEVIRRVLAQPVSNLAITVISVEEQLSGWYTRLRRAKKKLELALVYQRLTDNVQSIAAFRILSFTETAITRYEELKQRKLKVGRNDLCIAAIALDQNAVVVTRNSSDFGRIAGLSVEDWSA